MSCVTIIHPQTEPDDSCSGLDSAEGLIVRKLILRSPALQEGYRELLPVDLPVVLGRSRHADITIDDELLSRKHSQISLNALDQFEIRDLESTNLTIVNEHDIQFHVLRTGDRILLGDTEIEVEVETPEGSVSERSEQTTRDLTALPRNSDKTLDN